MKDVVIEFEEKRKREPRVEKRKSENRIEGEGKEIGGELEDRSMYAVAIHRESESVKNDTKL